MKSNEVYKFRDRVKELKKRFVKQEMNFDDVQGDKKETMNL